MSDGGGDVGVVGSEDAGCSGSERVGGRGVVSMSVADMVKHSVSLDTAIFAIGVDWRAAVCGGCAAGTVSVAVLVAGASANPACFRLGLRRGASHLPGIATVEGWSDCRNAGIVAFGSSHGRALWGAFRTSSRSRRIRPRPVAALLFDRGGSVSRSSGIVDRRSATLACAGRSALFVLWRHAGWIALVCGAPSLWKRGRIHCAPALLLLSSDDRQRRGRTKSWRDGRRMGGVRRGVDRDRRRAHTVCSARGGALELAADITPGVVAGARGREPVLARSVGGGGNAADAVGCAGAEAGRIRDMGRGLRSCSGHTIRVLFFSPRVALARDGTRALAGLRAARA